MRERTNLTAIEVEEIMQEARETFVVKGKIRPFIGDSEVSTIESLIKTANHSGSLGDKKVMLVNPLYVHIPAWQRDVRVARAAQIGNEYNPAKWDAPKVIEIDGKLYCVDGQHRLYGAYLGHRTEVVVEYLTISELEAIDLFLSQTKSRTRMTPSDYYKAAIAGQKPEYLKFREICIENNVAIKGDENVVENPVGIFTSLTDGVGLARFNPELLDRILKLLGKLQWNGGNDNSEGNAYSAKIIRVLKKLYAYYKEDELALEECLLAKCSGSEYYNTYLSKKWQDGIFDHLRKVLNANIHRYRTVEKVTEFPANTK